MRKIAYALMFGALCLAPARADDGSAQRGAGGIVFVKSADIRMAREDLYISPEHVRIRFEFQNTGRDQDVLIAFPLPDLDIDDFSSEEIGTVGNDPVNFVGFTAKVDGKAVALKAEQKAFVHGKDVSAIIRAAGLPLNLTANRGYDLLDKLGDARLKALAQAGVVDYEDNHAEPLWTVQTRFYWTQHFGAGKTVVIEHGYTPVTGGGQYFDSKDMGGPSQEDWVKPFCMDKPLLTRAKAMLDDPKLRAPDSDMIPSMLLARSPTISSRPPTPGKVRSACSI